MLSQLWILVSLLLIVLIFFQMPKKNIGLTSPVNKINFLGSPTFIEKGTKILIAICIFVYIFLAFKLNINI